MFLEQPRSDPAATTGYVEFVSDHDAVHFASICMGSGMLVTAITGTERGDRSRSGRADVDVATVLTPRRSVVGLCPTFVRDEPYGTLRYLRPIETQGPMMLSAHEPDTAAEPVDESPTAPGKSMPRQDGSRFVTGRVQYTADRARQDNLHMFFVRSEVAHGRIKHIDVATARSMTGVVDVVLAGDLGDVETIVHAADPAPLGGQVAAAEYLASAKVRYVGQPVAAVVATSRRLARDAAAAVCVEYEPLTPVLCPEAATREDAPLLYDHWDSNVLITAVTGDASLLESSGDDGLRIMHGEFRTSRAAPSPMEARSFHASWDPAEERLTWRGTTQSPHVLRYTLAAALRLSENQVRVSAPAVGGSFGMKQVGFPDEVLVAALARRLCRSVQWDETREEAQLHGVREQSVRYEAGYDDGGHVHWVRGALTADLGAMTSHASWIMPLISALGVPSGYDIPRAAMQWEVVVTNKAPWVPSRPFGKEVPALLMESLMDDIARDTGLDPLVVRRRNWISSDKFPYEMASGLQIDSGDYHELSRAVEDEIEYDQLLDVRRRMRAEGKLAGIGWAFELMPETGDAPGGLGGAWDTATVRMDPSGKVTVLLGVTSPGNGNETAIAQIVSAELGVDPHDVLITQGDTDSCPFGLGNLSSRGIVTGGEAARLAAGEVARTVRAVAANMLGCRTEDVSLRSGMARRRGGADDDQVPVAAVAHALLTLNHVVASGIEPTLEATRTFSMPNIRHIADAHGHINIYSTYSNALYACLVEVDPGTGKVTVLRHALGHDCGTVINPRLVEGQLFGGVVMGLGAALTEELLYDPVGRPMSRGFKTYLLPRADEVPPFRITHQVTPSPFSPLGTKGAGESGMACAMAGVLNAVNDALSPIEVRVNTLPMTPPRVLAAVHGLQEGAGE